MPSWLDRGAELAGYPWATGAEMACCTLLQILPRYNKVPSWRPPHACIRAQAGHFEQQGNIFLS